MLMSVINRPGRMNHYDKIIHIIALLWIKKFLIRRRFLKQMFDTNRRLTPFNKFENIDM